MRFRNNIVKVDIKLWLWLILNLYNKEITNDGLVRLTEFEWGNGNWEPAKWQLALQQTILLSLAFAWLLCHLYKMQKKVWTGTKNKRPTIGVTSALKKNAQTPRRISEGEQSNGKEGCLGRRCKSYRKRAMMCANHNSDMTNTSIGTSRGDLGAWDFWICQSNKF